MNQIHCAYFTAGIFLSMLGFSSDGEYYGVVESFDNGHVVVKTTKHTSGNWTVDAKTVVEGHILKYDWVSVGPGKGGHAGFLRFEDRPISETGTVKGVKGHVLTVQVGSTTENWTVTDATLGDTKAAAGDEVSGKIYASHNLAEITVVKGDAK